MNNNTTTSNTVAFCYFLFVGFDHVPGYEWSFVLSIVLNCILSVSCIIGNTIVLITIRNNLVLHTPSNCLLFSLAVSDLAVGLIVQPLCAVYKLSELLKVFDIYCISGITSEFLALLFSVTAFVTIAAISVDRLLVIHLHLRYDELVTVSRAIKVVVILWLFGLVITSGRAACLVVDCSILISILTFLGVIFLFVTIICYIKIWITVQRHVKAQVHPSVSTVELSTVQPKERTVTNTDRLQFHQKKKSVITMLYIVGTFIACYVPYICVLFLCAVVSNWNPFSRALLNVVFPIAFLNSTFNPVLYFWRMRDLRNKAKETLRKVPCLKVLVCDRQYDSRLQRAIGKPLSKT